jgi:hypothetical protein
MDNNTASEELVRQLEEQDGLAQDPRSNRVYPEDRKYTSKIDMETLVRERMEGLHRQQLQEEQKRASHRDMA